MAPYRIVFKTDADEVAGAVIDATDEAFTNEQGELPGLSTRVGDWIDEAEIIDPAKADITVEQLLQTGCQRDLNRSRQ